jgi:hypothetical protein
LTVTTPNKITSVMVTMRVASLRLLNEVMGGFHCFPFSGGNLPGGDDGQPGWGLSSFVFATPLSRKGATGPRPAVHGACP